MLTEQQLELRRTGIGGSDAAAIVGLSKWKSPLDVYLEKKGKESNFSEATKKRFYWGHLLEDVVAKEYEKVTGNECKTHTETLIHPKYPWMLANIDRHIEKEGLILECKTTDGYSPEEWGEPGTDQIPTQYLIQCAHYAIVCSSFFEVKRVDLAVLLGLSDFRIYKYERNNELEKKLIDKEASFWNDCFLKNSPPEPKSSREAALLWPDDGSSITATTEVFEQIFELNQVKTSIKELESKEEELKLSIQKYMKHATHLYSPNGKSIATWKTQIAKRFDQTEFQAKHPDLFPQFIKPSESRVFRPKEIK